MHKIVSIGFVLAGLCSPTMAQETTADIKDLCTVKWGTDFRMVKFCMDQHTEAKITLDKLIASANPLQDDIIASCKREWPGANIRMQLFCTEQQYEALDWLAQPSDIPANVIAIIKTECNAEWGTDYRMVQFCIEQQISAWSAIQ